MIANKYKIYYIKDAAREYWSGQSLYLDMELQINYDYNREIILTTGIKMDDEGNITFDKIWVKVKS